MSVHEAPPSGEEIIEALRRFLYEDIAPKLDPYAQFQCRVAVSLLGLLGREVASRDAVAEKQRRRLAEIFGDEDADLAALNTRLAAQLRAEEASLEDARIARHVRLTQEENLSISNPKWLAQEAR